jgi:hypothetical protein
VILPSQAKSLPNLGYDLHLAFLFNRVSFVAHTGLGFYLLSAGITGEHTTPPSIFSFDSFLGTDHKWEHK